MFNSGRLSLRTLVPIVVWSLGSIVAVPGVGGAQSAQSRSLRPELFGSIGWGIGTVGLDAEGLGAPNLGGGVALRPWTRLGVEIDVNRSLALPEKLRAARMGVVPAGATMIASANVSYFFGDSRAQPFLSAGYGALWSRLIKNSPIIIAGRFVGTEEYEVRNTVPAGNIGGGFLISMTRAISLRPELRTYWCADLLVYRASIGVGYHW